MNLSSASLACTSRTETARCPDPAPAAADSGAAAAKAASIATSKPTAAGRLCRGSHRIPATLSPSDGKRAMGSAPIAVGRAERRRRSGDKMRVPTHSVGSDETRR
jgi:hypothetical protein